MASGPDLFVVCKKCRSEVSPYITECPYCGTRLRKRAPKLEKGGTPKPPRKPPTPRLGRLRPNEIPGIKADKPYVTLALIAIPFLAVPIIATALSLAKVSWITNLLLIDPVGSDYWRYFTYPLLYGGTGYEVIALSVIALFGYLLERRHGLLAPLVVYLVAAFVGGLLATTMETDALVVGGNGIAIAFLCAWAVWDLLERRAGRETESDLLGVLFIALAVILLPLTSDLADWWVLVGGAATGLVLGLPLARLHDGE